MNKVLFLLLLKKKIKKNYYYYYYYRRLVLFCYDHLFFTSSQHYGAELETTD